MRMNHEIFWSVVHQDMDADTDMRLDSVIKSLFNLTQDERSEFHRIFVEMEEELKQEELYKLLKRWDPDITEKRFFGYRIGIILRGQLFYEAVRKEAIHIEKLSVEEIRNLICFDFLRVFGENYN